METNEPKLDPVKVAMDREMRKAAARLHFQIGMKLALADGSSVEDVLKAPAKRGKSSVTQMERTAEGASVAADGAAKYPVKK